jgi:hypothetical protein
LAAAADAAAAVSFSCRSCSCSYRTLLPFQLLVLLLLAENLLMLE